MEEARQHSLMIGPIRSLAIGMGMLLLGGGLVGVGYYFGSVREEKISRPSKVIKKPIATPHPVERPLPIAEAELAKGEKLSRQNPDAYEAAYINRRYRVSGKVREIYGTGAGRTIYEGQVFRLRLRPWNDNSKYADLTAPMLEFSDPNRPWALALRPGEQIDADCLLEDRDGGAFQFRYCRLIKASSE